MDSQNTHTVPTQNYIFRRNEGIHRCPQVEWTRTRAINPRVKMGTR